MPLDLKRKAETPADSKIARARQDAPTPHPTPKPATVSSPAAPKLVVASAPPINPTPPVNSTPTVEPTRIKLTAPIKPELDGNTGRPKRQAAMNRPVYQEESDDENGDESDDESDDEIEDAEDVPEPVPQEILTPQKEAGQPRSLALKLNVSTPQPVAPITPQVAQASVPPRTTSFSPYSLPCQAPPPQEASSMSIADLLTIGGRVAVLEKNIDEYAKNNDEVLVNKMNEIMVRKMNEVFVKKMHEVFEKKIIEVCGKSMDEVFEKKMNEVFEKKMNEVFEKKMSEVFEKKMNEVFEKKMNEVFNKKMNEAVATKTNEAFERVEVITKGFESKLEQLSSSVNLLVQEKESCINVPSNRRSLRITFD